MIMTLKQYMFTWKENRPQKKREANAPLLFY